MSVFLSIFFLLYGSIHFYAFLRVRAGVHLHAGAALVLAVFMLLMLFAPILVRILENNGMERWAIVLSQLGYLWMGLLFFFFVVSILVDFYSAFAHITNLVSSRFFSFPIPSARKMFLIPLLVSSVIFVYGYREALTIRTERITIASERVPADVGKMKIVQISDVHIGLMVRGERLRNILERVKAEQCDLLISTGDLLDGQTDRIRECVKDLKDIRPKYGKLAIMGNHEYYSGFRQAQSFFKNTDFTLLRGDSQVVAGFLNVVGFDDPAGQAWGLYREMPPNIRAQLSNQHFTLFLKHRPVVENHSGPFDLQLSGHTHQGQIFPFHYMIKLIFPRYGGFYPLPGNSHLYVNRGAGTWGPPIRFIAPPEITVIELIKK